MKRLIITIVHFLCVVCVLKCEIKFGTDSFLRLNEFSDASSALTLYKIKSPETSFSIIPSKFGINELNIMSFDYKCKLNDFIRMSTGICGISNDLYYDVTYAVSALTDLSNNFSAGCSFKYNRFTIKNQNNINQTNLSFSAYWDISSKFGMGCKIENILNTSNDRANQLFSGLFVMGLNYIIDSSAVCELNLFSKTKKIECDFRFHYNIHPILITYTYTSFPKCYAIGVITKVNKIKLKFEPNYHYKLGTSIKLGFDFNW